MNIAGDAGGDIVVLALALWFTGVVLKTRRLDPWVLAFALPGVALLAPWDASRGQWPWAVFAIAVFMATAYEASRRVLRRLEERH